MGKSSHKLLGLNFQNGIELVGTHTLVTKKMFKQDNQIGSLFQISAINIYLGHIYFALYSLPLTEKMRMQGIFLDIETTGLDFRKHSPVEIALSIIDLRQGTKIASYSSLIALSNEEWSKRDPSAISINGFTQQELDNAKDMRAVGSEIIELFTSVGIQRGKSLFICQNPSFDRAFFSLIVATYEQEKRHWPYHWLDLASMFWVRAVREWVLPEDIDKGFSVSKDQIAARLGLASEPKPHRAMNGVQHLLACYEGVVGFPQ